MVTKKIPSVFSEIEKDCWYPRIFLLLDTSNLFLRDFFVQRFFSEIFCSGIFLRDFFVQGFFSEIFCSGIFLRDFLFRENSDRVNEAIALQIEQKLQYLAAIFNQFHCGMNEWSVSNQDICNAWVVL